MTIVFWVDFVLLLLKVAKICQQNIRIDHVFLRVQIQQTIARAVLLVGDNSKLSHFHLDVLLQRRIMQNLTGNAHYTLDVCLQLDERALELSEKVGETGIDKNGN